MEIENNNKKNDWMKYVVVLVITLGLFAVAGGLSNFFTNKKVETMQEVQNKLATDILSSETQFSLLSELSCGQDDGSENLSGELSDMASKIDYSENNFKDNSVATELKRYYTILEIKDFILTKKINQRCGNKRVPILYFYTTAENCTECTKQGFVLTELRKKYPDLKVYSFDYSTDVSALTALLKIYKISDKELPALVIDENKATGFKSVVDIEKLYPNIIKLLPKDMAKTEPIKK
ncbi:MAG: hypothetical protein NT068_02640 [Candidatus Nomurabacteria bacterium]|nr:hypothetical protein [Candidatus Nomurabacteria bacterium]